MADYTLSAKITADITGFSKSLKTAQGKLSAFSKSVENIGGSLKNIGGMLENAGTKIATLETASVGVAAALGIKATQAAVDFEGAFAGVKKTVEGTDEQFAAIKGGILDLSKCTASSATDISAVAEAAGQLGIKTDNIVSFTKTMVELGDSTNLSAEEAASSLAKFANITQLPAEDYERLGSVIVDLGNNFATTEADIVNMATRLASAGKVTGLSQQEIMAFSAALSSAGIEAEAGGSAWSKLLKKVNVAASSFDGAKSIIDETGYSLRELELLQSVDSKSFKELANSIGLTADELNGSISTVKTFNQFASVAGMTAEEFKKEYENSAVGALKSFVVGLNDTERNGKNAVEILNDMGLTEVRLSNAILSMASSGDLMTSALDKANTAWDENTALQNEAQQRYDTTASKISQLKATVTELGIAVGETLLPAFRDSLDALKNVFSAITEGFQTNGISGAIDGLVNSLTGMANAGAIPSFFGDVADKVGFVVDKFKELKAAGVPFNKIAAGAAALAPALLLGGKASSLLGGGLSGISDIASGLGSAFGKIGGEASGFASWFVSFSNTAKDAKEPLKSAGGAIASLAGGIKNLAGKGLGKIGDVFSSIGAKIPNVTIPLVVLKTKLQEIGGNVGGKISAVFGKIGGVFGTIGDKLSPVIGKISDFGSKIGSALSSTLKVATSFGGQFTSILMKAFGFGAIGGLVLVGLGLIRQNFSDRIGEILTMVQEKGPQIITDFCAGITEKIPELITQGGLLITSLLITLNQLMPSIISGGADIIVSLVNGFALQLPFLLEQAGNLIITIIQGLTEKLPEILSSGMNVISALVAGISSFLPQLIPAAMDMILELAMGLVENLPMLIDSGIQLLESIVDGIINALPKLVEKAPEIIISLAETLIEKGPELIVTAAKLILKLADGLIKAIPQIIAKIPEIIKAIKDKFLDTDWAKLGKDIMGLVVDGLKAIVNLAIDGVNLIIDGINLIPNVDIPHIPLLANGTDDFAGGFARINEGGRGELVSLPNGTQVIPHDVSQRYAREAARMNAGYAVEIDYNAIGEAVAAAMSDVDLHTTFEVSGKVLGDAVTPYVDKNLGRRAVLANRYAR